MNRIPTEGLKQQICNIRERGGGGLNEQNPDRGIETGRAILAGLAVVGLE